MKTAQNTAIGGRFWSVIVRMVSRPSGAVGLVLVGCHVILAVLSPYISPYDFKAISSALMLSGPDAAHWLGTDHLGRDIFTRTIQGGRQALFVTGIATPIAVFWGGAVGLFTGLVGGRVDEIVMRVIDAFLSLPMILKLLVLLVTFGTGDLVLIPALAFLYGIPVVRIARAAAHDVVARDFVTAARVRGHGRGAIMWRELLPNVLDVMMVEGAMRWSWMLLSFSALSFLGFGVSPPTPDWGLMIYDARGFMALAPWGVLGPVIALSSLIIGVNLAADALAKTLGLDRARQSPVQKGAS